MEKRMRIVEILDNSYKLELFTGTQSECENELEDLAPKHGTLKIEPCKDRIQLKDLRKALKPLGFAVMTERFSFGRRAYLYHTGTAQALNHNVFTAESFKLWEQATAHPLTIEARGNLYDGAEKLIFQP
jgi:hypothetical protein